MPVPGVYPKKRSPIERKDARSGRLFKKRSRIERISARSEHFFKKTVTNREERCPFWPFIQKNGHQSRGKMPVLSVSPKKRSSIKWISARSERFSQKAVTNRKERCPFWPFIQKNGHQSKGKMPVLAVYPKKRSRIERKDARSGRLLKKTVINQEERCPFRAFIPKSGHQSSGLVPVLSVYPKKRSRIERKDARSGRLSKKTVTNQEERCPFWAFTQKNGHQSRGKMPVPGVYSKKRSRIVRISARSERLSKKTVMNRKERCLFWPFLQKNGHQS